MDGINIPCETGILGPAGSTFSFDWTKEPDVKFEHMISGTTTSLYEPWAEQKNVSFNFSFEDGNTYFWTLFEANISSYSIWEVILTKQQIYSVYNAYAKRWIGSQTLRYEKLKNLLDG